METPTVSIVVPRIDVGRMELALVGDSPLIVHAWSHKAKEMMLSKQMKKAVPAKAAKDPERDYQDSLYRFEDGRYGFPAIAFKAAAVAACRYADGVTMTEARGAFHIAGELVEILGEPRPREDMVRIAMGTADIRYRGEFPQWRTVLPISFNTHALSPEQIVNLFNLAGFGVGVGEWRPSSKNGGSYGRFHVASEEERE